MNEQQIKLRQLDYVQHMGSTPFAIRLLQSDVEGMSREALLADKTTQQAVVLNILTLGEKKKRVA